ncbi:juvenile hormone esterase-like [Macrobrachium rosenbergii]|uniref:juvenile hormone esterase-like n=1 Tax=Macrobrachium rosenbergii TaxID=79674 RepID=UPI0034D6FF67
MRFSRSIPPSLLLLSLLILQALQPSISHRTPLHSVDKIKEKFRELGVEVVGDATSGKNIEHAPSLVKATPEPTSTAKSTSEPTSTAKPTPEPTSTAEPTPEPTSTAEPTPEPTSTAKPTPEPTSTAKSTSEPTSTAKPTPEPTSTATPEPTTTPTPERVPRVTVEGLGTAKGTTLTSFQGREFYAFMSIPYGNPPEGDLRFKYPEPFKGEWPKETEEGEYEAVFLRARCVQVSLILDVIGGREDCLHLSIYTPVFPETPVTRTLPVMVWFHGGAYMTGDANLYVPTKLMDRDVMVVVVQYRLASFGFLAGNMEDSPGNMGLMDQITALRWIQNYIKNFGGNRDQVTVFGQSAGGASTSWMQLTPLTNGSAPANEGRDLFHRAIPQSGSALELWTIDPNPDDGFTQTASILNCNSGEDKAAMLSCMRAKDYTEIYNASVTLYAQDRINGGLGFKGLCPVVQDSLKGASVDFELVIPSPPLDILGQGDFMRVPMMAGAVRDEGSLVIGLAYKDYMEPLGHYTNDTDFVKYEAVSTLIRAFGLDDVNSAVANSMRVAYFPNAEMGNWDSMIGGMIDMTGVLFLKSGLWSVASHINRVAPDVPIYFYSWEFESDDSLFPWIFFSKPDIPVPGGTAHADELLYLFHLPSDQDEREKNMTDKMITLWTNFAKYGDPTPDSVNDESDSWEEKVVKWERYTNDDYNFMLMKDEFEMAQDFTTRWNYHRKEDVAEAPSRKDLAEMSTGERSEGEGEAPQAAPNDAEPGNDKNFKTTLVIFEGFLVLVVVSGCIYAIVRRQNGRRNGIV